MGYFTIARDRASQLRNEREDRLTVLFIKLFAWPSAVVNATALLLSVLVADMWTAVIAAFGAGLSVYAWLFYLEDEDVPDRRMGYRDIAARLRYEITEEHALPPGTKLDSVVTLAARYGSTRMTVSRALSLLAKEGLVEVIHGRGTYVLADGETGFREDRIKDHIERAIIVTPSGQSIPHTAELIERFGTTYSTVRRVQRTLSSRGVISRTAGGDYVRA